MAEKLGSPEDLHRYREHLQASMPRGEKMVAVCGGTGCRANRALEVLEAFQQELSRQGMAAPFLVKETGCHGLCEKGPLVVIRPKNIFYHSVTPEQVPEIVEKTLLRGELVDSLLYRPPGSGEAVLREEEIPFYQHQQRILFGMNGHIDPKSIQDYIAAGGYSALARALTAMEPREIVDEVDRSGLRGRGGGGFPTGRKWRSVAAAEAPDGIRYLICNADEGDPGAYMDRSVLEGNPHSVLEGMIIGSRAIGARDGFVYVRTEYPLAVENLTIALEQAGELGLLGDDILGSGHSFHVTVARGAGAFVCGESTALMQSLEGRVGRPRAKYVHTSDRGLYDRPSLLNNVETWATVPQIVNRGADWFRTIGTEGSKGTKIFSLVGKINNTGLVEVPMGITLRKIIFDIGGGIPRGKAFKAVQTGGPSGGCIPESQLDLAVDFDELTKVGSMMGSGGMIVMDEDTCMVDFARYFVEFLKGESCGKCVACREGLRRMLQILERITAGGGRPEDLETLREMGEYLQDTALCALGSTAANPVLTTLRYFAEEYESHIREKHCPAGACKSLFQYEISAEKCTGCGLCRKKCPTGAISGKPKEAHAIDQANCTKCGTCYDVCRYASIEKARVKELVA